MLTRVKRRPRWEETTCVRSIVSMTRAREGSLVAVETTVPIWSMARRSLSRRSTLTLSRSSDSARTASCLPPGPWRTLSVSSTPPQENSSRKYMAAQKRSDPSTGTTRASQWCSRGVQMAQSGSTTDSLVSSWAPSTATRSQSPTCNSRETARRCCLLLRTEF